MLDIFTVEQMDSDIGQTVTIATLPSLSITLQVIMGNLPMHANAVYVVLVLLRNKILSKGGVIHSVPAIATLPDNVEEWLELDKDGAYPANRHPRSEERRV